MSTLRIGAVLATVVAGPQLWSLVSAGDLDASTALMRWTAVLAVCWLGVAGISRIIEDYSAPQPAVEPVVPREVLEGTALRADDPGTPGTPS